MNRTLKLALGAVLGLGLVMPAFAQSNFPDIPDNHWAYQALANLKGKVLFGYPDGLYRPARPMSRAEFAVAVNQLYQIMMAKDNSLQAAIDELNRKLANLPTGGTGGVPRSEFDALKAQVTELQNTVNGMRAWGTDINNLKRLTAEFERELAAMDVDVDAMKRDMADMLRRLEALEQGGGGMPFTINGDGNFVVIAGHATDSTFGLTKTGRLVGYGEGDFDGVDVGMSQDLNVYHEFNTTLAGKSGENVSWVASLNFGNMVGWHDFASVGSGDGTNFGDLNSQNAGTSFTQDVDNFFYFDQLNASFDTSIAGQGFKATVGRFRHMSGPFFLARPDYTEFYSNERWDNGEFIMDGGMLEFMFGSVNLTAFATRNSDIYAIGSHAPQLNLMMHDFDGDGDPDWTVDSMLGVELGLRFNDRGGVKGVYYWQDSYDVTMGINRQNTFGGQIDYTVGNINLFGSYAQTDYRYNTATVLDDDNTAWAAWASYDGGNWGADAGYARVEGNFGGFGSWGRLGTIFNPSNIEGFGGGLWFQINDRFKISGGAAMFDGAEDTMGLFGVPLTTDDSVTSFNVKLDWMMNSAWNVNLGYESVTWDVGTDPELRWWNVGLKHNLSDRANISINYLLGDVDFKGFGAPLDPFGADVYKGGVLSSQVSFRF